MPAQECLIAAGMQVLAQHADEIERDVDMHVHVRIVAGPVEETGALRHLVPDHPVVRMLVAHDEGQFLRRALEASFVDQRTRADQAVAGEIPRILRPPGAVRRPVAGDQPAAQARIAGPGLLQRDLRPLQCAIGLRVRRGDPQLRIAPEARGIVIDRGSPQCGHGGMHVLARFALSREHQFGAALRTAGLRRQLHEQRKAEFAAAPVVAGLRMRGGLRRSHQCAEPLARLADQESVRLRIPGQFLPADCRRPHQVERRTETHAQFDRSAFQLVPDDHARMPATRFDAFAHREARTGIAAGDAQRIHLGRRQMHQRILVAAIHHERQPVVGHQLQRKRPELQSVFRIAARERAQAMRGDVAVFPWLFDRPDRPRLNVGRRWRWRGECGQGGP